MGNQTEAEVKPALAPSPTSTRAHFWARPNQAPLGPTHPSLSLWKVRGIGTDLTCCSLPASKGPSVLDQRCYHNPLRRLPTACVSAALGASACVRVCIGHWAQALQAAPFRVL